MLYDLAHQITLDNLGRVFDSCSIINAKSGNCPENCKWCAQSAHNNTVVEKYPLISAETAVEAAKINSKCGIKRFSLVTSGKRVSNQEVDKICQIIKEIKKIGNNDGYNPVMPCVSLGLLDKTNLQKLYDAGVTRYHCNIETSPNYFKNLCTTHTIEDKVKTIKAAQEVGMSVCSGGIIGMGESMKDRVEMAHFLRDLNILSIPINILHPIKGTPLENAKPLTSKEILDTIALFRIINPKAYIRFAGGRGLISKEIQKQALYIGVNAAIMGDMLTTLGSGTAEDITMFKEAGYDY